MELINYYKCLPKEDKIKYRQNPNKFALKHPARVLIVGSSGSGKTNILMNLLLNEKLKIPVERIYLFAKHFDSDGDSLYKMLVNHAAEIEDELFEQTEEEHTVLVASNDIHQIPTFDDLDPNLQSILIVDDFLCEPKADMQPLDALIIAARKANCSVIYLAQRLTPVSRTIRMNLNYVIAFNTPSKKEIKMYHDDYATDIPYDKFERMFNGVTLQPPLNNGVKHTLLIDIGNDDPYERYRQDILYPVHPDDWDPKTGKKYPTMEEIRGKKLKK